MIVRPPFPGRLPDKELSLKKRVEIEYRRVRKELKSQRATEAQVHFYYAVVMWMGWLMYIHSLKLGSGGRFGVSKDSIAYYTGQGSS